MAITRTQKTCAGACLLALTMADVGWAQSWTATVGGRVASGPRYEGSDETRFTVSPTLSIGRSSPVHRFTPPDPGATIALLDTRHVTAGPVLLIRRKREDEDELVGLRNVKRAYEPGLFVDVWPADWLRLHVQGRRGVAGHKGWMADAGADFIYAAGRWDASIGPRFGYASGRYMDKYFGVSAEEAALNPQIDTAFDPSGGGRYIGARAAFTYRVTERWRATLDAGYTRLTGDAADSPIVRDVGSRDQVSAGLSIDYTFGLGF